MRELPQEYEEKENMEDDLFHYVDIQTQNGVNNREENWNTFLRKNSYK